MNTQLKLASISIVILGFALMRCKKDEVAIVQKIETITASQITLTTALFNE